MFARLQSYILAIIVASALRAVAAPVAENNVITVGDTFGAPFFLAGNDTSSSNDTTPFTGTFTSTGTFTAGKRQDVTGDNNNNAAGGTITNGNSTDFSIDGSNDVSGLYNVGAGNTFTASNSSVIGNSETSLTKRQMGDNNGNSGNITNGDSTTFDLSNSTDVSGAYNVGSDDNLNLTDGSTLTGNTQGATTKRQTPSNNNDNSGTITNGNNTTFGITDSDDVSGVYNAGSGDVLDLDGSAVTGNTASSA